MFNLGYAQNSPDSNKVSSPGPFIVAYEIPLSDANSPVSPDKVFVQDLSPVPLEMMRRLIQIAKQQIGQKNTGYSAWRDDFVLSLQIAIEEVAQVMAPTQTRWMDDGNKVLAALLGWMRVNRAEAHPSPER